MFFCDTIEKNLRKFLKENEIKYYNKETIKTSRGGLANIIYFNSINVKCSLYILYSEWGSGLYLELGLKKYSDLSLFGGQTKKFEKLNNLIVDNYTNNNQKNKTNKYWS